MVAERLPNSDRSCKELYKIFEEKEGRTLNMLMDCLTPSHGLKHVKKICVSFMSGFLPPVCSLVSFTKFNSGFSFRAARFREESSQSCRNGRFGC
jgi:hypothetical protein